ncbi:MAG: MerR family transcriptional regulator [Flavobacteriaceae bacterium]|uniref:chaperone modulator CbpM n=1 Tax=Winogradskyella sp. SYSU M77433 TaxID=3042722 RepID=UPI000C4F5CA9|nr:chaperone modulator CbpM [Winogradskyella sp. SYSU M77433]MAX69740.1 MerR family transcriptional regulator [Flavobacteriaceae bacterium]MDH7914594.1 chaperone modulator CbpM [Winogradskyella sp. SYSU M77433]
MKDKNYISLPDLCAHHQIEMSFFNGLNDNGLIEILSVEKTYCIHQDYIADVEKMIRLHRDLNLNFEGIDTVFNLLNKIDQLQSELISTKNRLRRYEDHF